MQDVVSGIFLMEQVASLTELEEVLDEIERWVDDPELEEDIALLLSSIVGKLAGAPSVRSSADDRVCRRGRPAPRV